GSYNVSGPTPAPPSHPTRRPSDISVTTTVSNGTLGGSGTYTASAALTWSGGVMNGTGTTQVAAAATLSIAGGANKELIQRTLANTGTAAVVATGTLHLQNRATFNK